MSNKDRHPFNEIRKLTEIYHDLFCSTFSIHVWSDSNDMEYITKPRIGSYAFHVITHVVFGLPFTKYENEKMKPTVKT